MKSLIKRLIKAILFPLYERRLLSHLDFKETPHHVGIILDGNRRWAKSTLAASPEHGHQKGAEKIIEVLKWCEDVNVNIITLWLLSTDNLNRPAEELDPLLRIIGAAIDRLVELKMWEIRPLGALDLLPDWLQEKLKEAEKVSKGVTSIVVNVAVGYGGRREIVDAVRNYIRTGIKAGQSADEIAELISSDEIGKHLYTAGLPDPDLVIRTSGEQRLSGFLLWQSAHSEFYFCEAYWPDFRRVDFLRALRAYSQRHRRFGV
jgi:short-chain Z-isoprenyl diphosphate synthase